MKSRFFRKISFVFGLVVLINGSISASDADKEVKVNRNTVKVLVVALPDNVNSNYFPNSMITQETGIPEDSIDYTYNHVMIDNIITANKDKKYQFAVSQKTALVNDLLNEVKLEGSDEEKYVDLSQVNDKCYEQLIKDTDSDYVLFLNQHYLKWQEKPLRTLFHITSYSLFDKNQKEITRGNNYFTSMNLEGIDKLSKDSQKCSSKIASRIVSRLGK